MKPQEVNISKVEQFLVEGDHIKLRVWLTSEGATKKLKIVSLANSKLPFMIDEISPDLIREIGSALICIAQRVENGPADILQEDLNTLVEECYICEENFQEDELIDGVCYDCIDDLAEKKNAEG